MPDPHTERLSDRDLLIQIHTTVTDQVKDLDDHETRLRRVEKILWIGIGLSASIGSAVGSYVGNLGGPPTP